MLLMSTCISSIGPERTTLDDEEDSCWPAFAKIDHDVFGSRAFQRLLTLTLRSPRIRSSRLDTHAGRDGPLMSIQMALLCFNDMARFTATELCTVV